MAWAGMAHNLRDMQASDASAGREAMQREQSDMDTHKEMAKGKWAGASDYVCELPVWRRPQMQKNAVADDARENGGGDGGGGGDRVCRGYDGVGAVVDGSEISAPFAFLI